MGEEEQITELKPEKIGPDPSSMALVDTQVATAQEYPRDIKRQVDKAIAMVTTDNEIAESCGYALKRGKKIISGPSVNLAKILAYCWKNLRTEAKVVQITERQIVSRGTCWDLENNVASAWEVRRSIMSKEGRFSDDMITVTGNASNAIAFRNAVFSVIPRIYVDKVYKAAQHQIVGNLTTEEEKSKKRTLLVEFFKENYKINEDELVKLVDRTTVNQLNAKDITDLYAIAQSLKEGDTTVDELMKPIRGEKPLQKEQVDEKKKNLKKKLMP